MTSAKSKTSAFAKSVWGDEHGLLCCGSGASILRKVPVRTWDSRGYSIGTASRHILRRFAPSSGSQT